jgi:cytochrome c biogenesis protein CcdA
MAYQECTRLICYLEGKEDLISLPLITIAGLVDGINPCAIGMMVMLLGYLLVFAKKPERIIKTGLVYIATVFVTYLIVGLSLYSLILSMDLTQEARVLNTLVGAGLLIAGLIQLKDFLGIERGPHLKIPDSSKAWLMSFIEKANYPATIVLGILVTLLETPCSLPLYVGTATILSQSGMAWPMILMYFLYYNFLFVLPLIVVLVVVWRGKRLVEVKEWEHKAKKWMHLSLGVVLTLMAIWLLWG